MRPKWMRDLSGPFPCSICENEHVFFSELATVSKQVNGMFGDKIELIDYGLKCYCKECFEEYGGKDVKGSSSDSKAS